MVFGDPDAVQVAGLHHSVECLGEKIPVSSERPAEMRTTESNHVVDARGGECLGLSIQVILRGMEDLFVIVPEKPEPGVPGVHRQRQGLRHVVSFFLLSTYLSLRGRNDRSNPLILKRLLRPDKIGTRNDSSKIRSFRSSTNLGSLLHVRSNRGFVLWAHRPRCSSQYRFHRRETEPIRNSPDQRLDCGRSQRA